MARSAQQCVSGHAFETAAARPPQDEVLRSRHRAADAAKMREARARTVFQSEADARGRCRHAPPRSARPGADRTRAAGSRARRRRAARTSHASRCRRSRPAACRPNRRASSRPAPGSGRRTATRSADALIGIDGNCREREPSSRSRRRGMPSTAPAIRETAMGLSEVPHQDCPVCGAMTMWVLGWRISFSENRCHFSGICAGS